MHSILSAHLIFLDIITQVRNT